MRERRKVPRYQLGKMAMLYPPGGGVGTKAVVYAISTHGCAVECEKSPEVGKKCELYIDTETSQIGLEATAVSLESNGRKGLKFLPMDKETEKRLGELCSTLRIQALTAPVPEDVETPRTVHAPINPEPVRAAPSPSKAKGAKTPAVRERRRVPRYISELRASVKNPASGATSDVALITLSVLGGCMEGVGLPEPGQDCEVIADWDGRALRLPGKIVWKTKNKWAGVRFEGLDEAMERMLRQVCANLRLQPLAPLPPEPE